jgi:hypothetical protein
MRPGSPHRIASATRTGLRHASCLTSAPYFCHHHQDVFTPAIVAGTWYDIIVHVKTATCTGATASPDAADGAVDVYLRHTPDYPTWTKVLGYAHIPTVMWGYSTNSGHAVSCGPNGHVNQGVATDCNWFDKIGIYRDATPEPDTNIVEDDYALTTSLATAEAAYR